MNQLLFSFLALVSISLGASAQILQFQSSRFSSAENREFALITVVRSGSLIAASVFCQVTNGTATALLDYENNFTTSLEFTNGQRTASFVVPLSDDTLDEPTETILLRLFNPSAGTALGARSNAVLSLLDNDRGGTIRFQKSVYRVHEEAESAILTVLRSGGSASGVSVDYSLLNRSATGDEDFEMVPGTVFFDAGNQVVIPLIGDGLAEGDETFVVRLSNPQGGAVLGAANATVVLVDDEVGVQLSSISYLVSEASSSAVITVDRTGSTAQEVTVDYVTEDGTAFDGSDFTGTTNMLVNTVVFPRGVKKRFIRIPITKDTEDETNETFTIRLTDPSDNVILGVRESATVTIVDNDAGGLVRFSSSLYLANERTEERLITVTRSRGAAGGVTVDYQTIEGSALSGEDFQSVTGRLTFGPGVFKQTFNVPITHDILLEGVETARVTLNNVTGGASLGAPSNAIIRIGNYTMPGGYAPTSLVLRTMEVVIEDGGGLFADSGEYNFITQGTNVFRIDGSGVVTNISGGTNVITTNTVILTNVPVTVTNISGGTNLITTEFVNQTNFTTTTNLVGATTNISGVGDSVGTYHYVRTGPNTGEIIITDTTLNIVSRQILTMTMPEGGTFVRSIIVPTGTNRQFGTFQIPGLHSITNALNNAGFGPGDGP